MTRVDVLSLFDFEENEFQNNGDCSCFESCQCQCGQQWKLQGVTNCASLLGHEAMIQTTFCVLRIWLSGV